MHLTTKDKIRLTARSFALWFGLLFFTVGLFTLPYSDWLGTYFYFTPLALVPGRVVGSEETSFALNEARVYETFYRYRVRGQELVGSSFNTSTPMRPDTVAEVEYCINQPAYSRLKNSSTAPFGLLGLLTSLSFIAWGLITALQTLKPSKLLIALLNDAAITEAVCQRLEPNNSPYENAPEFIAHYTYQVYGQQYTYLFETSATSKHNIKEPLVFQRAVPTNVVLLDSLPEFIRRRLPTSFS